MRLIPILLLFAASLVASTRPPIDDKHLVALDSRAGGFDAYWIHRNELAPEVTTRLLRTPLTLDGRIAGPTVLIREDEGWATVGVAGSLVFHAGEDRVLYVNDKVIARNADLPDVLCGTTLCAALWRSGDDYRAQFLDREANAIGAPFTLPPAWYLYAKAMVEDDLVVVRAFGSEVRATRIGLAGAIRYDVLLLAREHLTNEPPAVAISHDGARSAFAIVETPWLAPSRVHGVTIDANGVAEPIAFDVTGNDVLGPVALVWDGARHQLITRTTFGVPLTAIANGGRIAVAWTGFRPTITVFANGVMTAPVQLDEAPRRRTVNR